MASRVPGPAAAPAGDGAHTSDETPPRKARSGAASSAASPVPASAHSTTATGPAVAGPPAADASVDPSGAHATAATDVWPGVAHRRSDGGPPRTEVATTTPAVVPAARQSDAYGR